MFDNTTSKSKVWDSNILSVGGVSYWLVQDLDKIRNGELKPRYRVALSKGECSKMLKWKIKNASGEVFSVAAKSQKEANLVVAEIYGKNQYTVSQMMC